MLYRYIFLVIALAFAWSASAQTPAARQTQWADSLAGTEAGWLKQQFQLSAVQTDSLHQASMHAYTLRKQVLARYWKSDSFPAMIRRADRFKDSLYLSILGQRRFYIYKDTLFRRQERLSRTISPSPKPTQQ